MRISRVVAASFFAATFLMSSLSADTAVQEPEAPVTVTDEETTTEEDTNCSCCSPYGGFYAGVAVGCSSMKLKNSLVTTRDAAICGEDVDEPVDNNVSKSATRFIGTFILGGGMLCNNGLYAGLNVYFDIGPRKKVSKTTEPFEAKTYLGGCKLKTEMKSNCWSPALALRLGYVPSSHNTLMVYLDLGAAYRRTEFRYSVLDTDGSLAINAKGDYMNMAWLGGNKITPLVRLGFQKALGRKIIVGAEAECAFKASRTWDTLKSTTKANQLKMKATAGERFTARVFGLINFNLNSN